MDHAGKARQRNAAAPDAADVIEAELASLLHLPISELRAIWRERLECEPPKFRSRSVLLNELAWRMQADAFGDLDSVTERRLAEIGKALERDGAYEPKIRRDFSPGVVLTREWKGTIHKVTVMAQGFQYLGKRHRSLSDIARTITRTRWSGPRFFGLEQKKKATREAAP